MFFFFIRISHLIYKITLWQLHVSQSGFMNRLLALLLFHWLTTIGVKLFGTYRRLGIDTVVANGMSSVEWPMSFEKQVFLQQVN